MSEGTTPADAELRAAADILVDVASESCDCWDDDCGPCPPCRAAALLAGEFWRRVMAAAPTPAEER